MFDEFLFCYDCDRVIPNNGKSINRCPDCLEALKERSDDTNLDMCPACDEPLGRGADCLNCVDVLRTDEAIAHGEADYEEARL